MSKSYKAVTTKLDQAIAIISILTVFLTPIFFNPFGSDLFDLSKKLLLATATGLIIVLWTIKNILTRSVRLTITPFTLAIIIWTAATMASSFTTNLPQLIESFVGTTSTMLFLAIIFVATTTSRSAAKLTNAFLTAFVSSGVVLAVLGILEALKFGPGFFLGKLNPGLFTESSIFITPVGSVTILIGFLIPTLVAAVLTAFTTTNALSRITNLLSSAIIMAAIAIGVFNVLPGKPNSPIFLPFSTSWEIAVENIKNPKSFTIGVGASNYTEAFSAYKPASFNLGELWNTRFAAARNYPLHLFTTTGIIGLGSWLLILAIMAKIAKNFTDLSSNTKVALAASGAVVIISLFLPPNLVLNSTLFFLTAIIGLELKNHHASKTSELMLRLFAANIVKSSDNSLEDKKPDRSELLPIILGVPTLLIAAVLFYGAFRVAAADFYFQKSQVAAVANDGTNTYDFQRMAVSANPFSSSYHRAYASTNLAIANVIGANEELSDTDRANITTLIQQAIREAKAAVQVGPNNTANWESLAGIYRNLINVAEGATDWSTASYVEAIRREPTNPALRLELGGIYYQLQDYQNATRLFGQAADLKPNWPNAHYNLANAYAQNGEIQRAVASYDSVLQLIEPGTEDYQKTLDEQNELKKKLGQKTTEGTETAGDNGELKQPAPLPSPVPAEDQIQLDESSAPPAGTGTGFSDIVEPTPTPEATPTP